LILERVPPHAQLILGADVNAKLAFHDSDELAAVLGPHGPPCQNVHGSNLLALYLSHNLRVENTFFDASFHCTYTNIGTNDGTMIHIFACAKQLHCRVCNCRAVIDGVESDHSAVQLDLAITSLKRKSSTTIDQATTNWRKIVDDKATNTCYNDILLAATNNDYMPYEDFHDKIKKVGNDTALLVKSKGDDWFIFNRDYIAPLISKSNQLIHTLRSSATLPTSIANAMRDALARFNKTIKDKVLIAKARWVAHLCSKIHDMAMNPRLAWEHIRLLTGSSTAHHKKSVPMAMKMPNGNIATNGKENMSVFGPHFERIFNNHPPVDLTILDKIAQRPVLSELDLPISFDKVNAAINKLKNVKNPGLNGIPPEAYKAMNSSSRRRIHRYIADFFEGDVDYPGWHQSQCVPVPKKGNLSNPNKWRGVMLMDVCSKIFLSVMNSRAFRLLELHGTKFQFGGTPDLGCKDGLFTLKTLINTHKNHHLPLFVTFVDLVKAYDTVNHDLLLCILEKYGAPPKFVASIRTMYTNLVVVLKIEKEIQEIKQSVGVCQGNNMAPVLFLFLMSAAAKTLEVKWREAGIAVLKVAHSSDNELESGCICGHTPRMYNSTRLTAFEIFQLLYVEDSAFPFLDCNALIVGINLIYSHFACFGLEIHIGWGEESSKTECVFFPPPQFFNDNDVCSSPRLTDSHADNPWLSHLVPPSALCTHVQESESACIAWEDAKYDALTETAKIDISNGYVTFSCTFKYLGSKISYSLHNNTT
jgi:hypothetical protein